MFHWNSQDFCFLANTIEILTVQASKTRIAINASYCHCNSVWIKHVCSAATTTSSRYYRDPCIYKDASIKELVGYDVDTCRDGWTRRGGVSSFGCSFNFFNVCCRNFGTVFTRMLTSGCFRFRIIKLRCSFVSTLYRQFSSCSPWERDVKIKMQAMLAHWSQLRSTEADSQKWLLFRRFSALGITVTKPTEDKSRVNKHNFVRFRLTREPTHTVAAFFSEAERCFDRRPRGIHHRSNRKQLASTLPDRYPLTHGSKNVCTRREESPAQWCHRHKSDNDRLSCNASPWHDRSSSTTTLLVISHSYEQQRV